MFTDKKFEKLDEISQLVEPMTYSLNDKIIALPERIEIPPSSFAATIANNRGQRITYNIQQLLKSAGVSIPNLSYRDELKFYRIEMTDDVDLGSEEITIDLSTKEMEGKIFITKHNSSYTDEELHDIMCKSIEDTLRSATHSPSSYDKTRLNEVASIFDLQEVKHQRSSSGKRMKFITPLMEKIKDHTVNIRDVDLGMRFGGWIKAYIRRGSLGSIKNLCKLKVMTHSGKGIYSIEDEDEI